MTSCGTRKKKTRKKKVMASKKGTMKGTRSKEGINVLLRAVRV